MLYQCKQHLYIKIPITKTSTRTRKNDQKWKCRKSECPYIPRKRKTFPQRKLHTRNASMAESMECLKKLHQSFTNSFRKQEGKMLLNSFCEFSITLIPELQPPSKEENTNNQRITLINIHTRTLNKILANQRQQYIKKENTWPIRVFPRNARLIVLKIIHLIHYILKWKRRLCMIISIGAGKTT